MSVSSSLCCVVKFLFGVRQFHMRATFCSQVTMATGSFHRYQPLCLRLPPLFVFPRSDPSQSLGQWVLHQAVARLKDVPVHLVIGQVSPLTQPASHLWFRNGISRKPQQEAHNISVARDQIQGE